VTQSPDHPELVFLEALKTNGAPAYTIGRPDGPPIWIVMHDMEATERATCAEDTAQYFHTGAGGRSVSSHYCCDDNSIVQCVRLKDSAWTVGNRPGNNRGINYELCGFASQTRDQWLDAFGEAMFERVAVIIRSDAARYNIPLVRRTVAELKAWKPGVTSHNDLREAFGNTTHTDPGANFPWDYFIPLLNGEDMSTAAEYAHNADTATNALAEMLPEYKAFPTEPLVGTTAHPNRLATAIHDIQASLARIEAALGNGGGGFVPHQHITDGGTPDDVG